jgi:hypothetical protein
MIVTALGLLCGAAGCHHTSGICDCLPDIQPCAKYGMYPALGYHQAAIVTSVDSKPAEELKKTSAEMESAPVPMGSDLPQGQ